MASRCHESERQSEAAADVSTIVNVQYREGMTDSLAAMLAQRDAIAGALAENRALFAHRQAIVAVYRALGGGWCAAGQAHSCG